MSGFEAILAAASTAVSVAGAIQQGQAARKSAEYQAQVAENNAIAARQQADYDERQQRRKTAQRLSTLRAAAANAGVLPEEGSPLFVDQDTSLYGEMDALNLRRGGTIAERRARSEAELTRMKGRQAQTGSYYKAGASLLKGL